MNSQSISAPLPHYDEELAKALQAVNEAIKGVKAAKAVQKEAEEHLDSIRKARLDTAPTLF